MTAIKIKSGGETIETTTEAMEQATETLHNLPEQTRALAGFVNRYREIMREREELLQPIKQDLEELKLNAEGCGSTMAIVKGVAKTLDTIEEKGLPHYHAVMAQYGNALDALGVESGVQLDLFGRWVSGAKQAADKANKDKNDIGDTKGNA